ncbi:MAG: aminotransferase class I/II-fold pyridoxal phosphate-dependent enzyme, partial [Ruminiclostridium sp.]
SLSLVELGDVVIVCEPGYMTYKPSGILAKAEIYTVAAHEEDNYLPRLETIPLDILNRTRLFFVNYPNNPTGAVAPLSFFSLLVNMARECNFIVCNDNAYSELYYGNEKPPSILQVPGSLDVAVEMNSLSKTFNVCGWRTGMLLGNSTTIKTVLTLKQNTDAGIFMPLQLAAAKALLYDGEYQEECRRVYSKRSSLLVNGLREVGFDVLKPEAGMFVWVKVPDNLASIAFCETMIAKCGIACNPGSGFGNAGEGYVRFALTVGTERIEEALERIKLYYS